MINRLSRREFIRVSAAGALLLSAACAPAAPSNTATAGSSSSGGAGKGNPYPTFIPLANGPKPDYHTDDPRFDDGFDNYPANPIKAVAEKPGTGSTVNVLNRAYFPPPTPFDQNPTWQEINRQLNANMNINVVASPDYQTKFVTTMASDDLPDIMHIYNGYALAPNLPAFFKAKCADLTPYLAGDAAKEYPYLAAIPTYAWKNSVSAIDGALYLIPIQRHLPIFPSFGGYFFTNTDIWNKEIGEGYVPKSADDLKRILLQLNRPQEGRWGIANQAGSSTASEGGPFALYPYVNYQADLPGFAKAAYDAQQLLLPLGVADPTDGFYSATAWSKGQTADVHFQDGVVDIILGRRQMSEYDDLVKAWQTDAGETVRKEFMESMAAAKA